MGSKACSVDGCGKPAKSGRRIGRPLCDNHASMLRRHGRLERTKPRRIDYAAVEAEGRKTCTVCAESKPLSAYVRIRDSHCGECHNRARREKRGVDNGPQREQSARARADRSLSACRRASVRERISARLTWAFDHYQDADPFTSQLAWHVMGEMGRGPWSDPRLSDAEQYRIRYRFDPSYQINERLRRQVTKQRKRRGIQTLIWRALKDGGESPTVERQLGYTIDELRRHLERQFTKGMSWDRFMRGEIHIDHIVPVKEFNVEHQAEFVACWSMANLRPLWAKANMAKGARRVSLL